MDKLRPIFLLIASNTFMTFAWYGNLKIKDIALWKIILVSWGIAFFEYCFMIPANRIGIKYYSAAQLKVIQEIVTLTIFGFFSVLYLREPFRWNHLVAFAFIIMAAIFMFKVK